MKQYAYLLSLSLALPLILLPSLEARTFKENTGREIEAELVSVAGDQVTISKNGEEFILPMTRFSAGDQAFIKEWSDKPTTPMPTEPPAVAPENAPEPGETLKFDFPDLVKDFSGKPASFSAKIPGSYDATKPVGLMIFLGGGNGSNAPSGAQGLTNDDFVCVGLPYPDDGRNPNQNNMVGSFREVWDYWKPMLARLEEAVPNLDPKLRIIGGFSNGGHAIDGLMGESEFVDMFSAFILIDGGGALGGNYRNARDKHAYVAFGEKSPNNANSQEVVKRAGRAGLKVVDSEMTDTGHAFPASEKELVKKWLYEVVIPDLRGSAE